MIDFTGQVAVVTGAGRGLGRLYAMEMARRGACVVVNDLGGTSRGEGADASVAGQVVAEIEAAGGRAVASHDSVTTRAGGAAIVQAALDHFGRIDIVVSNAGIFEFTPFEDLSDESWRRMLSVHLDGGFHVSQPAFRAMKAQGYGRLVFVSSSAGMFGVAGNAHYGTAKAGLVGLSNVLALEGAEHGIRSNALLPFGFSRMVTDSIKGVTVPAAQQAFFDAIEPELVVPLVVYLASRDCAVSHQNFTACAGRYARVFVGLGQGWLAPAGAKPGVEDIAAHLEDLAATAPFTVPGSQHELMGEIMALRGIDLGLRG